MTENNKILLGKYPSIKNEYFTKVKKIIKLKKNEFMYYKWISIEFSSVTRSCLTFGDCIDYNTLGFPVHHQLPEFTQVHVHWVGDAIQPSHPLSSLSPPAFNLPQYQGLFHWVSSSHQVAKVLDFQLQHQSFQWIIRTDLL